MHMYHLRLALVQLPAQVDSTPLPLADSLPVLEGAVEVQHLL